MKKGKSTTQNLRVEKTPYVYLGDYYCLKDLQGKPVSEGFLKVLAQKLLDWVRDPEALSLVQFFDLIGLESTDFYRWKDRSDDLMRAYRHAREVIGTRREVGAIKKQYDGHFVAKTLYQYKPEYAQAMEFLAKLAKAESNINTGTQFVVLPKIESAAEMEQFFKKKEEDGK